MIDYLLPTFKSIESDKLLTQKGLNFWKKLMVNHPEYSYCIKSGPNEIEINDSSYLNNFWNSGDVGNGTTFVVKI